MGKNPAFLFYPSDWSRDLEEYPLEIEGAWIRICCKLWWAEKRGRLTRSWDQWAKILRCDVDTAKRVISYVLDHKIGSGNAANNGDVTVESRRMIKDEKERELSRLRQERFREKRVSNANITPPVTQLSQPSSVSVSVSVSKKKEKEYKQKEIPKAIFGEFQNVLLSEMEHEKLIREYAEERTREMIEILSSSLASRPGNKYSSHYAVIRNWERRGWMEGKKRGMLV